MDIKWMQAAPGSKMNDYIEKGTLIQDIAEWAFLFILSYRGNKYIYIGICILVIFCVLFAVQDTQSTLGQS